MYASYQLPLVVRFAILLAATYLSSLAATRVAWADPPEQSEQSDHAVEISSGDVAELGVMVVDSPGVGVLVKGVIAGRPAEAAGVTPGDFIVAIDGNGVEDPNDLSTKIRGKTVGSVIAIDVWREGNQVTRTVQLAKSKTVTQKAGRAWLGVKLNSFDPNGVRIAEVVPGSPAERAMLRSGDLITAIGDAAIGSLEELIDTIKQQQPGITIALTILRDGNELSYEVELGSAAEMPFYSFRVPLGDQVFDPLSLPGGPMFPVPPPVPFDPGPSPWAPWRQDLQQLKTEMEQIREQLRRGTGEETESPSEPSSDHSSTTPEVDQQSFAPMGVPPRLGSSNV